MIYFNRKSAAKYFFVRDNCNTVTLSDAKKNEFLECSLLGISDPKTFNYIVDMFIPKQTCTATETDIDQADRMFFYNLIEEKGLDDKCRQTWFHTHPGSSANPSSCDRDTWRDVYLQTQFGFGGMGIIAKNKGKNCTFSQIIYDSIIGQQSGECHMLFEAYPDKWVSFEYIYDIEEANDLYGCGDIHSTLFAEFAEFHEEWLKEIKEKVTEKIEYPTNTYLKNGSLYNQYANHYGGQYSNQYTSHYVPDQKKKKKKIGTQQQTTTTNGQAQYSTIDQLIDLYCNNGKNSLNEFDKSQQQLILKHFKTTQAIAELAQQQLKKNETAYTYRDVIDWENENDRYPKLVDLKSMTNLAKIFSPKELYQICSENIIRPCRLVELVDDYISYLKGEKK